jgi:hypothetical protein
MGPPKKATQSRPARSQKIRCEATSAVPGEVILSRLALQLARSRHRRELILHPSLVERRSAARLIPIGLPGRPAAWTTRSPGQRPAFFMKKPPMCHKPGLWCTASGEIDLSAFLGVSSLDLASLRRGIFLGQMARDRAVSVLHAANVSIRLVHSLSKSARLCGRMPGGAP